MEIDKGYKLVIYKYTQTHTELLRVEFNVHTVSFPQVPELDGRNISCAVECEDSSRWIYIRKGTDGLPPMNDISKVALCDRVEFYQNGRIVYSQGQCYIVDDITNTNLPSLNIVYAASGIVGPIRMTVPVSEFKHTKDNRIVLTVVDTSGCEYLFIRNDRSDIAVLCMKYRIYTTMYVEIKDSWGNSILYGHDLLLLRPKYNTLSSVPVGGSEI
jgi:hypothetical protein